MILLFLSVEEQKDWGYCLLEDRSMVDDVKKFFLLSFIKLHLES